MANQMYILVSGFVFRIYPMIYYIVTSTRSEFFCPINGDTDTTQSVTDGDS